VWTGRIWHLHGHDKSRETNEQAFHISTPFLFIMSIHAARIQRQAKTKRRQAPKSNGSFNPRIQCNCLYLQSLGALTTHRHVLCPQKALSNSIGIRGMHFSCLEKFLVGGSAPFSFLYLRRIQIIGFRAASQCVLAIQHSRQGKPCRRSHCYRGKMKERLQQCCGR
jgi:hypothetical protein